MFRNLYLEKNKRKIDITEDGDLSCAFFVSNLLLIWGLISEGHATINGTIKDMEKNSWKKIPPKKIKPGDIIVWEEMSFGNGQPHLHLGFYIGNKKAVSNSHQAKFPTSHVWNYNGQRKITAVYSYSKF